MSYYPPPQQQHANSSSAPPVTGAGKKPVPHSIQTMLPDEFIQMVKMYIDYDNQIHEGRQALKLIQDQKEKTEQFILHYMKSNKMEDKEFNLTDGKLKYAMSRSTAPISKNHIQERLQAYLKSKDQAQKATEYIFSDREVSFTPKLKRTMSRSNKQSS
jgi:Family of unknown function (DUF5760)